MSDSAVVTPEHPQPAVVNSQPNLIGGKLSEAHRRLPFNLLSNVSWMVLNILVGLWYTPFLIAHLGIAVYGLIPLASSIANYLGLMTNGFNSAVSRFLQIELASDDIRAANRIFNTSVAGALAIFAFILPIALLAAWLAPTIFHVPGGHESDAQWLVLLTMLAFATAFLAGSFAVSSFATHRFDLRLYVNVIYLIVQIGSVVALFAVLSPRLWQVGVGIFISELVALLGDVLLWRRLTPQLKIQPSLFEWGRLKTMLQFSGWVLVNQAGALLFLNIDLVVANLIFGAKTAGRYGAVLLFPALMRNLVGTIDGVLVPIVFTMYGQNNISGLARFCRMTVKFMGLVIALPIGLICGLAKPLLTVWLGPEYAELSWLVVVLVSHLCINLAVVPLFSIQSATNHVRLPGILTLFMGVANASLAVALALWSGLGYMGIAVAGAIVLTAKNAIFTPLYNARNLRLPWWTFLPNLATSVLATLAVSAAAYWISLNWTLTGWLQLALAAAIITGIYVVVAYFLGLGAEERSLIKSEIRQRLTT
jgi:membrane protein EpsK